MTCFPVFMFLLTLVTKSSKKNVINTIWLGCLFFWCWVVWAACIFWKLILCQLFHLLLFSPILRVVFSPCLQFPSPKKTYRWLRNTWKDAQHCSLLEKCESKLQWDITSYQSEWPSSKNLQTINAGEGVEKRERSCTVCGNANWYSDYGRWFGDSLKN